MPLPRFRLPVRLGGLSLGALLAACGGSGGGSSTPEAPPAPAPSTVAVTLTAPAAQEVFEVDAPLSIRAQVTINGAPASDGTPVRFAATSGTLAAAATTAQGGVATATLTQATPGRQQLTVSATAADGQSATTTRTVYLRPAPRPLEVLVPAYFYPTPSGSPWDQLAAGVQAVPGVSVTAILNPSNGVFTAPEAQYTRAASQFVAAGGKVIGYVHSNYGTRALAAVQADVDNYLRFYGRNIVTGIFVDEMSSDTRQLEYYQSLYRYIKAQGSALRVVGNPGAVPDAAYAAVADVLVTYEGQRAGLLAYDPRTSTAASWLYARPNTSVALLGHNIPTCAAMQEALAAAATARYNAGPVFFTDGEYDPVLRTGNPWAGLPHYWTALLQSVDALNRGRPLPTC